MMLVKLFPLYKWWPFTLNIFTFLKQVSNESKSFATVHSLINDTNLIDSCQAHLPVQYALNIKLIHQK